MYLSLSTIQRVSLIAVAILIGICAELPLRANADTVASQIDNSTTLTPWNNSNPCNIPGCTYGSGASTSTIVRLGTPFTVDTTVQGLRFYMESHDDGTNGSYSGVGLYYFDPVTYAYSSACTMNSSQTSHSVGSTTVNISNSMQLVEVQCDGGPQVIDHTRELVIALWAFSVTAQTAVDTLGSSGGHMFYEISGNGAYTPIPSLTRIISVSPVNGSTIATSTSQTLEVKGYVNPTDYASNMQVTVDVQNHSVQSALLVGPVFSGTVQAIEAPRVFTFTPTGGGFFDFSTTTSFQDIGQETMRDEISTQPLFSFFGIFSIGGELFDSTTTVFTVSTSTAYDVLAENRVQAALAMVQAGLPDCSSTIKFMANLQGCIYELLVPTQADTDATFNAFGNALFTRVPFGYITRFIVIITGHAGAVEPPALTYTFGSSSPAVLQGTTVTFQIWDNMGSSSPLLLARADDGSNKDIWDIVDPYFEMVVAWAVFLVILADVVGIFFNESEWREKEFASDTTSTVIKENGQTKTYRVMRSGSSKSRNL